MIMPRSQDRGLLYAEETMFPDHEIHSTPEDISKRFDRVLQFALDYIP